MIVAIYKSGPKAGMVASTADAIAGFPGSQAEAITALGFKNSNLPKSLRSALRRRKSSEYPVVYLSPSVTKEFPHQISLKDEHLPKIKTVKPIHTVRFTKFSETELPKLEGFLKSHKNFSIQITPFRTIKTKDYSGQISICLEEDKKYLFINGRKNISLKDLGQLSLTPLS